MQSVTQDLLHALAVAGMMGLAWLERVESAGLASTVLGWGVPLGLGAVAFASLRIVHRMQQEEDVWEEEEEEL